MVNYLGGYPSDQQATAELEGNLLGGAGEEGLGEMLGGRGGYGSGFEDGSEIEYWLQIGKIRTSYVSAG